MADFEKAFSLVMREEGGYKLTNDPTDRGGQTYAGIARKFHRNWAGWRHIDAGDIPPTQLVRDFYHAKFWLPVRGGDITSQRVAEVLFSQHVNMGVAAIKLAQTVLGVQPDGAFGAKSLAAINAFDESRFLDRYCVAMIARYHAIGMRDMSQRKFWPGWIARALRVAA